MVENESGVSVDLARAMVDVVEGHRKKAVKRLEELAATTAPRRVAINVNWAGYQFLNAERLKLALEIFKINIEMFPEGYNTWDSLGEAYMKLGKAAKAIAAYEKSLELNPENTNAEEMIARIRGDANTEE